MLWAHLSTHSQALLFHGGTRSPAISRATLPIGALPSLSLTWTPLPSSSSAGVGNALARELSGRLAQIPKGSRVAGRITGICCVVLVGVFFSPAGSGGAEFALCFSWGLSCGYYRWGSTGVVAIFARSMCLRLLLCHGTPSFFAVSRGFFEIISRSFPGGTWMFTALLVGNLLQVSHTVFGLLFWTLGRTAY